MSTLQEIHHEGELLRNLAMQEDPAETARELAPFLTADGEWDPVAMARAVPVDEFIARIRTRLADRRKLL